MKYGLIKSAAATPKIKVADCKYNTKQIIDIIINATSQNIKLLVFPELCITGYTCSDLFSQKSLIDGAEKSLLEITGATANSDMICIVGLPIIINSNTYNCAAVIQSGKILGIVPKTNIPSYGEFYEVRHFTKAPNYNSTVKIGEFTVDFGTKLLFKSRAVKDFVLAVEICEDLWVPNPPSISHAMAGAIVIANLSAGNEVISKEQYRRDLVNGQSGRLICGYVYSSAGDGESTTDIVFSGHNIIAENGSVLAESKLFENSMIVSEIDVERLSHERGKMTTFAVDDNEYKVVEFDQNIIETKLTRIISSTPFVPFDVNLRNKRCEAILTMQSNGLKKRLEHIGSKAVIGISGGLDSCLALLVSVRAMDLLNRPRTDVIAVTMPCFGTTKRTKSNAQKLCEELGVTFKEVDITNAVKQHFADIGQDETKYDITYENSQARERTQVLMDIANMCGAIVIGTGDLSELALGWATYNGDQMSMYGVNSSIPKTLVRYLVQYYADSCNSNQLKNTLIDIYNTPVSPELIPGVDGEISQKTEKIVGPYELHDFFLYYVLKFGFTPSKIYHLALNAFCGSYDNTEILKWLKIFYKRFIAQQFKRSCMPDGAKVGTIALSPRGDWRMPSDASAAAWLDDLDTIK